MNSDFGMCNCQSTPLAETSVPRPFIVLKKRLLNRLSMEGNKIKSLFMRFRKILYKKPDTTDLQFMNENKKPPDVSPTEFEKNNALKLNPGEWVEVKSYDEILLTLDEKGKHKGLAFTPDMVKFCGGKYKVFKKVHLIRLESNGENRKIKIPTVLLENVYCDGKYWDGCDRACFHFWREAWLKRTKDI